ncbi:GPO family capsid scaffolding protein [Erythrobacter sp. SG61-1L]|uniref:GPO family capsid scaffolding protein n=1 Tax=Erythrobacter sp. SG61-1L TaxID=1603897 RepID=UPI0006C92DC4|nr:GPO family capsid scaffolding protein [Erythrobacter sp. SG61-1L]
MKTKKFLLATSGATVDGRNIDAKMLKEMASSFNPKTYGARLNIEHIRGISGDGPFRAYGDVLELSTEEIEVDFNGQKETRTGLYGVFEVTEEAKKLNAAGQKVYPSIEIEPNFAGKDFAYLMGCALTDSPASIGTDRLTFNRKLPGTILLTAQDCGIEAALLELMPEGPAADAAVQEVKSFFSKLTAMLPGAAPRQEEQPKPAEPAPVDFAKFASDLGETLDKAFTRQAEVNSTQITALTAKVDALAASIENTEAPNQPRRPPATGPSGNYSKTDC